VALQIVLLQKIQWRPGNVRGRVALLIPRQRKFPGAIEHKGSSLLIYCWWTACSCKFSLLFHFGNQ
jgi:hypothetical protein